MTPSDLVALVARLRATVPQYYGAWSIIQSLQEEAAAAIEQLQAEVARFDERDEERQRRWGTTVAQKDEEIATLRAELAVLKEKSGG